MNKLSSLGKWAKIRPSPFFIGLGITWGGFRLGVARVGEGRKRGGLLAYDMVPCGSFN